MGPNQNDGSSNQPVTNPVQDQGTGIAGDVPAGQPPVQTPPAPQDQPVGGGGGMPTPPFQPQTPPQGGVDQGGNAAV